MKITKEDMLRELKEFQKYGPVDARSVTLAIYSYRKLDWEEWQKSGSETIPKVEKILEELVVQKILTKPISEINPNFIQYQLKRKS